MCYYFSLIKIFAIIISVEFIFSLTVNKSFRTLYNLVLTLFFLITSLMADLIHDRANSVYDDVNPSNPNYYDSINQNVN